MKRDPFGSAVVQCPRCDGGRTIRKADCPRCHGFGFIRHQFKLAPELPGTADAFNLAGECKPDPDKVAREIETAKQTKAQADAYAAKHQTTFDT